MWRRRGGWVLGLGLLLAGAANCGETQNDGEAQNDAEASAPPTCQGGKLHPEPPCPDGWYADSGSFCDITTEPMTCGPCGSGKCYEKCKSDSDCRDPCFPKCREARLCKQSDECWWTEMVCANDNEHLGC